MADEIVFRPAVEKEIEDIVSWYELHKKGLGILFLEMLDIVFQRIQSSPLQFPVMHKAIRKATVKDFPYNVYFRIYKNHMVILAVLHQKRNPKIWKRRS